MDFVSDDGDEFAGVHVRGSGQLGQLALILLGEALARVETALDQDAGAQATLGFLAHRAQVLQPVGREHNNHQDAQVAENRVDEGDQVLEADEGQAETDDAGCGIDRVEALGVVARQALAQGVEHADGGVEDHAVDDEGHEIAQCGVDAVDEFKHRHVRVHDLRSGDVERDDEQRHHDEEHDAAQRAAEANGAVIQEVAADDDGHRDRRHDRQAGVVQGGNPPGRQRGLNVGGRVVVHRGEVNVVRGDSVNRGAENEENDERGDKADNGRDAVHVEQADEQDKDEHDHGADPDGDGGELLRNIRAATGEHDKADGKERHNGRPVEDLGDDRVRDFIEDGGVLVCLEVRTKLEGCDTGDEHEQRREGDTSKAPVAEGNEVLQCLLAGSETRTNDDTDERHGDCHCAFKHEGVSLYLIRAGASVLVVADPGRLSICHVCLSPTVRASGNSIPAAYGLFS